MKPEALKATFLDILARVAPDADLASIRPDESLREQIDLDSMDLLKVAREVHAALGVDVPELDYPKLDVLDDAVAYLQARLDG